MEFVKQYYFDMFWKYDPKDTHERFNSPFPNLGPDVLDGHPKSGAVCGRSEACASGRVVEGVAEYDELQALVVLCNPFDYAPAGASLGSTANGSSFRVAIQHAWAQVR